MRHSHPHPRRRAVRWPSWICALLLCLSAGTASAAPPTVDGRFWGPDDVNGEIDQTKYTLYATSVNGSVLYSFLDIPNQTLYVALVVSHTVNDTVCSPQSNRDYTASAGWGNTPRPCNRLTDSEFAEFTLECAPDSTTNAWTWQQALGCSTGTLANGAPSGWISDPTCGPSSPAADWPPGVALSSSTSWVKNVNTYQSGSFTPAWNLYAFGFAINDWKSPFVDPPDNNDVTLVPGYNTYSTTGYRWEWSMVYEWSVFLGQGGTNCGDQPIFFITGSSHHSPAKNGEENDCFFGPADPSTGECPEPPDKEPLILSDWGDLPEGVVDGDPDGINRTYGTTDGNNGARHYIKIGAPFLGPDIQTELDGVPTAQATGDGSEEDGVVAVVDQTWTANSTQSFEVTVSNAPAGGALLAGWFDWNGAICNARAICSAL